MKQLHFLAGLPRSGSTLLTSILYQNPEIHTEGNSALCAIMWNTLSTIEGDMRIKASQHVSTPQTIVGALPKLFYVATRRDVVIDKSFTWTLSGNIEMIQRYVIKKPKFIVMERPVEEIVNSFVKLMERNKSNGMFQEDMDKQNYCYKHLSTEERRRSAVLASGGVMDAPLVAYDTAKNHKDQSMFHYVSYADLVNKTKEVVDGIYSFLELPHFEHNFTNIKNHTREKDAVWGLDDMHEVRRVVGLRK